MPANLPPEYFEADKRFKAALSPREKIAALEELIATVPKHKGTDKLRADLRRKLSKLKEEAIKKKKGGKSDLCAVEREGAAQITLVGFPNSGKSSLLQSLTNARPVIADYPMSTVAPLSGMMPFEDILFQLVDLPPIGNEATDGWVSGIVRNSDMLLLAVDLSDEPDTQAELLIEQIAKWNMQGKKVILAANKRDIHGTDAGLKRLKEKYEAYPTVAVSSLKKEGLEELKGKIYEISGLIRVYTKEPGKEPDLGTPFTMPSGSTVLNLAEMIHKDFVKNMKYACIWGSSKFPGQRVHRDHVLKDRDIVEFHL